MPPQPLLQFGTVTLQPAPNGGVVDRQAAFLQKLFHIPKRQGVPKVPAHRAENQDGFGLPPLEDRRSGCHFRALPASRSSTPEKWHHSLPEIQPANPITSILP